MRKTLHAPILLLALVPFPLAAQSIVTVSPQQCVWRAGDDPAWAAPNLDESAWKPYAGWKLNPDQPHYWVRCHADLSPLQGLAHPAIQVTLYAAYQLYLDGAPMGEAGDLRSGNYSMNSIRELSGAGVVSRDPARDAGRQNHLPLCRSVGGRIRSAPSRCSKPAAQ